MSFSWSASSSPSFVGMKPMAPSSFADALKRLAEHVEEKNKTSSNNNGPTNLIQSSIDLSNRINPSHVNNSISSEHALRLYTQYIHEAEKREDIRRSYLRTYSGTDGPSPNASILNRRFDVNDPYRFSPSHLPNPFHPSAYFRSFAQPIRIPPPSLFTFPNTKTTDTTSRLSTQENIDQKSEQSPRSSKPKLKLFRPYDLDSSTSNSHPTSPTVSKKSTPSPTNLSSNPPVLTDESQTVTSSGKEKQLFNSLGLIQQSVDVLSEKQSSTETSPSVTSSDESSSVETLLTQQDIYPEKSLSNPNGSSLSGTLKRKSSFSANMKQSSNRKQTKIVPVHNTES